MCLKKSDPNHFRCEWKKSRIASTWVDGVVNAARDAGPPTSIGIFAPVLTAKNTPAVERLQDELIDTIADELSTALTSELVTTSEALGVPRGHAICALLAEIGEACVALGSVPSSIADAIAKHIEARVVDRLVHKKKPWSQRQARIAAKVVAGLAHRLVVTMLSHINPGGDTVARLGVLADCAAVNLCPAQPGDPPKHPEVEQAAARLAHLVTKTFISQLLKNWSSTQRYGTAP